MLDNFLSPFRIQRSGVNSIHICNIPKFMWTRFEYRSSLLKEGPGDISAVRPDPGRPLVIRDCSRSGVTVPRTPEIVSTGAGRLPVPLLTVRSWFIAPISLPRIKLPFLAMRCSVYMYNRRFGFCAVNTTNVRFSLMFVFCVVGDGTSLFGCSIYCKLREFAQRNSSNY